MPGYSRSRTGSCYLDSSEARKSQGMTRVQAANKAAVLFAEWAEKPLS